MSEAPPAADEATPGTGEPIRVFLLDDHEVVRRGVRDLLEADGDRVVAGASGYVLKQIRGNELVESVRKVAAGRSLLDPAMTARVIERLRRGPEQDDRLASLTPQERRILTLLADGLTNRQIGEQMFLAEKTVKNYVSNLLMKLGMSRRTEAAVYAARHADLRRDRP